MFNKICIFDNEKMAFFGAIVLWSLVMVVLNSEFIIAKVITCRIVTCRQSMHILQNRTWKEGDEKMHFESGVHMGIGTFNLVCSQVSF